MRTAFQLDPCQVHDCFRLPHGPPQHIAEYMQTVRMAFTTQRGDIGFERGAWFCSRSAVSAVFCSFLQFSAVKGSRGTGSDVATPSYSVGSSLAGHD